MIHCTTADHANDRTMTSLLLKFMIERIRIQQYFMQVYIFPARKIKYRNDGAGSDKHPVDIFHICFYSCDPCGGQKMLYPVFKLLFPVFIQLPVKRNLVCKNCFMIVWNWSYNWIFPFYPEEK